MISKIKANQLYVFSRERTPYPIIPARVEEKCEEGQWRWGLSKNLRKINSIFYAFAQSFVTLMEESLP